MDPLKKQTKTIVWYTRSCKCRIHSKAQDRKPTPLISMSAASGLEWLTCGINVYVQWLGETAEWDDCVCKSRKQHSKFTLTPLSVYHKAQSPVYPSGRSCGVIINYPHLSQTDKKKLSIYAGEQNCIQITSSK